MAPSDPASAPDAETDTVLVGNLKKVSLELGGKSPAIVFPDADLSVAIPGAANGIFFNMGQCCTAGSRLFVHERVFDKMMTGLSDEASKLKIGLGLDPGTRIGPLVSDEQLQRVTGFLGSGRQQGAEVVTGGKLFGNEGYFVEPRILTRQAIDRVVYELNCLGLVFEAEDGENRAEHLLAGDAHIRFDIGEDRWLDELTAGKVGGRGRSTAEDAASALGFGDLDVIQDFPILWRGGDRPDIGVRRHGIALARGTSEFDQALAELVADRVLHQHA